MAEPLYRHNEPLHINRQRKSRRWLRVLFALLIAVIVAGAILAYILLHLRTQSSKSVVGAKYTHNIAGPTVFKSEYFEFSDTAQWYFSPSNSTPYKFTYLLNQDGVLGYSVSVYVNQRPAGEDLATTRVLPVQIKNSNSFTIGQVSDPCGTLYKPSDLKFIKMVSLSGTTMECIPDSPQYIVIAGQVGGSFNLTLKRTNGQTANYIIIYHDLTATPDPGPFLKFMQSFQSL
jgi:hypothetical protein